jgi:hypothetical protein
MVIALPAGVAPIPTSDCVPVSNSSLSCYVGLVTGGSAATVTASALAVLPGTGTVAATVSAHVVDSNPANDGATASVVVELKPLSHRSHFGHWSASTQIDGAPEANGSQQRKFPPRRSHSTWQDTVAGDDGT